MMVGGMNLLGKCNKALHNVTNHTKRNQFSTFPTYQLYPFITFSSQKKVEIIAHL